MIDSSSVSLPVRRHPARVAATLLMALLLLGLTRPAAATHIRAGDIQAVADPNNLLRYFFTLRLYLDTNSIDQVDADICFGDGTFVRGIPRSSGPTALSGCVATSQSTYTFSHVFPGPGRYDVSFTGNNRNSSILNLGVASSGLSFYIFSSLLIDAGTGPNNSAVFNSIPIDQGVIGVPFLHSPAASDSSTVEHDSLSFELVTPRQGPLTGIIDPCDSAFDIASYLPLDQFATGARTFRMDPATGLITWDSPALVGLYNIAYVVKEWRRLSPEVVRMVGSTTRDMQISITDSRNKPPVLRLPADTCVIAGRPIDVLITATDPEGFAVTLTGEGGAFVNTPAATLTPVPGGRRDSVTMRFRWTPNCRSVARQPYLTTLSARDTPPSCDTELATIGVWQVRVVGPPPDSLVAEDVMLSQVRLRWKPYACAGTADSIRIYRRLDSLAFTPGPCQTGIPPGAGYVLVGSVAAGQTTFLDTNKGRRFKFGTTYCYRIYATWPLPGGGEGIVSNEACATMPGLLPQLINATVDATDTLAGQTTVRWTQGNHGILATIYESYYRLSRAADDAPTAYTLVRDRIRFDDTMHVDTNLDTKRRQYRYRLEFVLARLLGPEEVVDTVAPATTPRLEGQRVGDQINLTWAYVVPWDNTPRYHYIYRRISGNFERIDSVLAGATGGAYTDRFTYRGIPISPTDPTCYRVLTRGTYVVGTRKPAPTENYSQEQCVKNTPCPPSGPGGLGGLVLVVPDCAADAQTCPTTYTNDLSWTADTASSCALNLTSWRLYFQPPAGGAFGLLATLPVGQFTYSHSGLASRIGCYYLTSTDSEGTESSPSNTVCQDNCDLLTLPNIITPNADSYNDTFRPICASPLRRVAFTVYNRWGVKVYESDKNPLIEWTGTATGGQRLPDGTYFYRAEVEFDTRAAPRRFYKGWVEVAGGRESSGGGR